MSFKDGDIIVATEDIIGTTTQMVIVRKGSACFVTLDSAGGLRYKPITGIWYHTGAKARYGNRLNNSVASKFKKI